MPMTSRLSLIASTLLFISTARQVSAAPGPPRLDDSSVFVVIENTPERGNNEAKYGYVVSGRLVEPASADDMIQVAWVQRGKVLDSVRCKIDSGDSDRRTFECKTKKKDLKAVGDIEVRLRHIANANDAETPLRTLKVSAVDIKEPWIRNTTRPYIQVQPASLLANAVASLSLDETDHGNGLGMLSFVFWYAIADDKHPTPENLDLRCSVGGQRLTGDFSFRTNWIGPRIDIPIKTKSGQSTVEFERGEMATHILRVIPNSSLGRTMVGENDIVLNDHPGDWACQYRSSGEVIREFRFRVAADGRLVPHPEQSGPNALYLERRSVLLDVRFPSQGKFDYKPMFSIDAMKKQSFYGRPWSTARTF